jgi:hypothetical protein
MYDSLDELVGWLCSMHEVNYECKILFKTRNMDKRFQAWTKVLDSVITP